LSCTCGNSALEGLKVSSRSTYKVLVCESLGVVSSAALGLAIALFCFQVVIQGMKDPNQSWHGRTTWAVKGWGKWKINQESPPPPPPRYSKVRAMTPKVFHSQTHLF
jgi:hypothetical protein